MNENKTHDHATSDHNKESEERTVTSTEVVAVHRQSKKIIFIVIAVFAFCVVLAIAGLRVYSLLAQHSASVTPRPTVAHDGNAIITQNEADISNVVAKVSPSVVSVLTQSQGTTDMMGATSTQDGAGTGIIVGQNGYILTNKHVIDGANAVSVVLADGTRYDNVTVVGSDPLNDIAFLKIPNVNNLPVAELGDSTSIRVGESVIAIGNSLGQYQNTVTSGIISGTGRPISAQEGNAVENLSDLIQTDAAINPGNSGGPLLNLQGQVIGINTAVAADAQGIGFSIPIGATKGILKSVLQGGSVQRAYLGVNYMAITADVAKQYQLPTNQGAYVYSGSDGTSAVIGGSPADQAGIKNKDIITKVGNISVGSSGSVSTLIGEYAPGDTVNLTVLRGGQTVTIKVTLAAYKA